MAKFLDLSPESESLEFRMCSLLGHVYMRIAISTSRKSEFKEAYKAAEGSVIQITLRDRVKLNVDTEQTDIKYIIEVTK